MKRKHVACGEADEKPVEACGGAGGERHKKVCPQAVLPSPSAADTGKLVAALHTIAGIAEMVAVQHKINANLKAIKETLIARRLNSMELHRPSKKLPASRR